MILANQEEIGRYGRRISSTDTQRGIVKRNQKSK